jgi:Thioesterase-like superfamily
MSARRVAVAGWKHLCSQEADWERQMSLANEDSVAEEAGPVHTEPAVRFRVLYADTDAGGVVYNAAYLRFLEGARTEAMRAAGVPYTRFVEQGLHLPIVEQTVRYRRPAYYDDLLARMRLKVGGDRAG